MKKIIRLFACLSLFTCLPGILQAQSGPPWVKYNVGYNYILRGVDFPSGQDNTGFISGESLTYSGNGIVLKTTDGGVTWTPVWTGANEGLEGSCFVDLNTGFIAGWPKLAGGWSGFAKTTDGGTTWTSLPVDPDLYYFTDVVFKDATHGILTGATNTLARVWVTSNGGTSWTTATGLAGVPYHACWVSGNTYFLADNAGHIQKSVNNGSGWTTVHTITGGLLTGIDFLNDTTGMACGDNGVISKTYDGGVTWTDQVIGVDIWHDFGWETTDHVYVCGTPEIVAESTDGGATWGNGFPGSAHNAALYECTFTAGGWGYICGSQGTLLKRVPSCKADFSAAPTAVCIESPVTFTSLSSGSNLTYHWTFEGGTPSSSTAQNPVITYASAGTYDVKLVVNNGYYSDSLLKTNYISASVPPAPPVIWADGYNLTSTASTGNQWYRDGNLIPGATGQGYTVIHSGLYWDVTIQNGCSSDTSNNLYILITGNNEHSGSHITISPVPCDGRFILSIPGSGGSSCSVTVFNDLGVPVFKESFPVQDVPDSRRIDLQSASPGVYTLVVEQENSRFIRKVIICR
jgi:photosystem II stability/assembly factor-like uncharacterized protein